MHSGHPRHCSSHTATQPWARLLLKVMLESDIFPNSFPSWENWTEMWGHPLVSSRTRTAPGFAQTEWSLTPLLINSAQCSYKALDYYYHHYCYHRWKRTTEAKIKTRLSCHKITHFIGAQLCFGKPFGMKILKICGTVYLWQLCQLKPCWSWRNS